MDLCEFDEAIKVLFEGLQKLPSATVLHYHLAGLFFIKGQDMEGAIELRNALLHLPEGKLFFLTAFPVLKDHPLVLEILHSPYTGL